MITLDMRMAECFSEQFERVKKKIESVAAADKQRANGFYPLQWRIQTLS